MSHMILRRGFSTAAVLMGLSAFAAGPSAAADPADGWTGSFATYAWLPWITGDVQVKGVALDVDVSPNDILSNLDWSTLPVWMSYGELKNGRLTLFNDIVWSAIEAADGFDRRFFSGSVQVDYSQLTVELGAAYQVWTGGGGSVDVLAGGRYWRQDLDVFADVTGPKGGSASVARSGTVDWVDPFIGLRYQQVVAPGQSILVRGDIGGFGAGSDFSWQAMATYNFELCVTADHQIDGYLGYRALSVDYSEGNYTYDAVQQGPVMGVTMKF